MVVINSSAQQITCSVNKTDGSCFCYITLVYAFNSVVARRQLWLEITDFQEVILGNSSMKPWCLMGDFNIYLHQTESNRPMPRRMVPIDDFRSCVNNIGLTDLRYQGMNYTWWDCNLADPVMRKLDRVLVNDQWLET